MNAPLARLLTKLGSNEAANAWRALIDHNPESYAYYAGYIERLGGALGLSVYLVLLTRR